MNYEMFANLYTPVSLSKAVGKKSVERNSEDFYCSVPKISGETVNRIDEISSYTSFKGIRTIGRHSMS